MGNARILMLTFIGALMGFNESIKIPPQYVLHVDHTCGEKVSLNKPVVSLVSDVHVVGKAICKNGMFNFTQTAPSFYELKASYINKPKMCVFKRVPNTQTYVMRVEVYFGEEGGPVHTQRQERIITCTFDDNAAKKSANTPVKDPPFAPKAKTFHIGKKTTSTITLNVVDVRGNVLNKSVQRGRYVQLMATTNGANKELGLRPVNCDAVGIPSQKRHAIIRAGCGDGSIFKLGSGFTTKGLRTFSPYFPVFQLNQDTSIDFECNMSLCTGNCDGSSCANARQRRSSDNDFYFIKTEPVIITLQHSNEAKAVFSNDVANDFLSVYETIKTKFVTRRELWVVISILGFLIFLTLVTSFYTCFMSSNNTSCNHGKYDCVDNSKVYSI